MSRLPFPGAYPTTRTRRLRTDGAYADEVEVDGAAAALRPDALWPRVRLVNSLLALGRRAEALPYMREVQRLNHP